MLSRRDLFRGAGAAAGTALLGGAAGAQPAPKPPGYTFFSPAEAQFVEAAVDRLIPPDEQWAGAVQAGVPSFIDSQLAGPYGAGSRLYLEGPWKTGTPRQGYQLRLSPAQLYRIAIEDIGRSMPQPFHQLPPARQDEILHKLESGELELARVPSAVFFETLLSNTIEGFFADPIYGGNRDMVGWRMIGFPGAYASYVDFVGRHGLKFDRAPVGIASQIPH